METPVRLKPSLTPYFNRVIHGDCIPVMRQMPSGSIDLVITDPPYLVDYRARDGRTIAGDRNGDWLRPAFTEIHRLLKPDSFCVSFYGWNEADQFVSEWKRLGLVPVSHFAFVKEYSSREGYTQAFHESAYLLAKGRPPKPATPIRDVLPREYTGNEFHPHQKPVSALEPLIKAFSRVGDVVLDPFAGSGSTGLAARNCGRNFILIEKTARYHRNACLRLDAAEIG
jgi:adenine-specific DNA-methyltransferase